MSVEITDPLEIARRVMAWRNISPLPTAYSRNKTTDPEARDYERSIALFREGLRAARRGDLQTGRTKIAAACLLDYRCSRWFVPVTLSPEYDPEMQDCVLDHKLLLKLAGMLNLQENDLSPHILFLFLAIRSGSHQQNQALCEIALQHTQQVIDKIAKDPSFYENNPHVLDGCLTRAAIHHRRGNLYDILNNAKKAAREYKKAFQIEPENYKLLAEYAMIKYCYCPNDSEDVVRDCKSVVANIHPDNRRLRHMYAILAVLLLQYPAFGTLDEALAFYDKMEQCRQRQITLHGEHELQLQGMAKYSRYANEAFHKLSPQDEAARRAADSHMSSGCAQYQKRQQDYLKEAGEAVKRLCMNCRAAPENGVKLRKCSRCKQVAYCSKECQVADWKNHKMACKLHAEKKKQSAR